MSETFTMYIAVAFAGYILGSLPMGYWIAQWKGVPDITKRGSGNIGATNVSRVLGARYFVLVFLLDACKAFLFLQGIQYFFGFDYSLIYLGWFSVLLGNGYSIFLGGRGGKGVSTVVGLLGAVAPYLMGVFIICWAVIVQVMRKVALGSLFAMTFLPVIAYVAGEPISFIVCLVYTAFWSWWRHYENVKRMLYEYAQRTRA